MCVVVKGAHEGSTESGSEEAGNRTCDIESMMSSYVLSFLVHIFKTNKAKHLGVIV